MSGLLHSAGLQALEAGRLPVAAILALVAALAAGERVANQRRRDRRREWYRESYLKSEHWRERRLRALEKAGWCCQRCPRKRPLDVHHRSYARLGRERDRDLVTVGGGIIGACATATSGWVGRLPTAAGTNSAAPRPRVWLLPHG